MYESEKNMLPLCLDVSNAAPKPACKARLPYQAAVSVCECTLCFLRAS